MTTPIRAALIGYGLGGRYFHAPVIAATPGIELCAVVTSDAERRRAALTEHPGVRVVQSADALFAHARDVDLVVISTPNRTHVPLALAAIEEGKAVVVDKPMAPTAADARRLVDAAERKGVLLTVYQNRRWDGDFMTVRRLIADGKLGEVYRFESRFERWRPAPKGGWRELQDPAEAGGLLYDLGSHLIDQALCLFGGVTGVYAELDGRRAGVTVDDDVFVALTHASGVRSHLWASVVSGQSAARLRVLGSKAAYTKYGTDVQEDALRSGVRPGAADWGSEPPERWGRLGAGEQYETVPTVPGAYPEFFAGVVRAMRADGPVPVDPRDAVASLEIIERARQLAGRGVA